MKIRASVGQTFTYEDAAPMTDFRSRELNRTFKEILFISKLTLNIDTGDKVVKAKETHRSQSESNHSSGKVIEKKDVKIEAAEGGISISVLAENKKSYAGKTVKIKGKVTKFSSDILNRNWVHIQDGTDFKGKYDLVVTTDKVVKEGDVLTFEGKINLDRDFGSGYFFDVIMEDAKIESK